MHAIAVCPSRGEINYLTVCYFHVTYTFQSESTPYNCPNVKGTPSSKQSRYLKLTDSNGIRDWVVVYELSGSGFESRCCQLITSIWLMTSSMSKPHQLCSSMPPLNRQLLQTN